LPAARSLRLGFPDAYICWAVHRTCRDVVEGSRYLDDVYVIEDKSVPGIIRAGRELSHRGFDTSIDMQGLFRSGLLSWLSGAKERIGFSGTQELHNLFVNRPAVKPGSLRPAPYCQMQFAVAAGGPLIEPVPEIFVSVERRNEAAELLAPALAGGGPIVAVNPGAAWATKRWSLEGYAAAAEGLQKRFGAQIIITGGPGDAPAAEEIAGRMTSAPLLLAGKTSLKTLAAVFERCALYLGGDTGPMHIAAAMSTPVLAIFGPTDPEKTGPVGAPYRIVRHDVPCGPCRLRECDHHTCMRLVTVHEVITAAGELLTGPVLRVVG
nr:glycosyltransferase family 9 protein [Armatimonadota bacterium]